MYKQQQYLQAMGIDVWRLRDVEENLDFDAYQLKNNMGGRIGYLLIERATQPNVDQQKIACLVDNILFALRLCCEALEIESDIDIATHIATNPSEFVIVMGTISLTLPDTIPVIAIASPTDLLAKPSHKAHAWQSLQLVVTTSVTF